MLGDLALGTFGYWEASPPKGRASTGTFHLGPGFGVTARIFWNRPSHWRLGFYVGFMKLPDGEVSIDNPGDLDIVWAAVPLGTQIRGGFMMATLPWRGPRFNLGLGGELGLSLLSGGPGEHPGLDFTPEFFFEIPLTTGSSRVFLNISFALRAGMSITTHTDPSRDLVLYFSPIFRIGVGAGH